MKYELIGRNDFLLNPIETILKNRGIVDMQSFLDIKSDCVIHWSKLRNINNAVDCLIKHAKGGGKVFLQVDADP